MDFFSIRRFGTSRFAHHRTENPAQERFERHCHPYYELLYIVEGSGKFVVEGAEYPLHSGMIMLLRPYEYHFVCPDSQYPYERVYLNFSRDDALVDPDGIPALQVRFGRGLCFLPEGLTAGVGEILQQRELYSQLNDEDAKTLFCACLTHLLLVLSLSSPMDERVENVLTAGVMQYLTEHLECDMSLEELAKQFYVSKYHLCRVFRNHAGVTVLEYLTAKRVARAQMLMAGGASAAEAARQSGFAEYSTFYRAYRRCTGKVPTGRKKQRRPDGSASVENPGERGAAEVF